MSLTERIFPPIVLSAARKAYYRRRNFDFYSQLLLFKWEWRRDSLRAQLVLREIGSYLLNYPANDKDQSYLALESFYQETSANLPSEIGV